MRYLYLLLILAIIVTGGFKTYNLIQNDKQIVEKYCSVKNQHSVDNYKMCKQLSLKELVIDITEKEQAKTNSVAPLMVLK
jgi:hypothetical protein